MRSTALALVIALVTLSTRDVFARENGLSGPAPQAAQVEATAWRQVAEAIPLGSKVRIQTHDARRISGTLMRVDGRSLMVKRNTRRPEAAITINFDGVATIERTGGGGVSIGKAIAIGVATGAGVILSMFVLVALQLD